MRIIMGVTGSISAYKSVEILRLFQKSNHSVNVILTENAKKFIAPLTFETFAPNKVYDGQFKENQDPLLHINICSENDLFLVAPATANIIAKMANGIADDLLSTTLLAFSKRVVVAPAMNTSMYDNIAVQDNLSLLRSRGIEIVEPEEGSLACREKGRGRLAAIEKIVETCLGIKSV